MAGDELHSKGTLNCGILGFHVTSQALLKAVSAMLVSLGCQIMLIIGHFYSEACLLSVNYFANYMNIQKEKTIKVPGIHLKVFQCSLRMPKGLERRVIEIFWLWLWLNGR